MAFTKKTWVDRVPTSKGRYSFIQDGNYITLTRADSPTVEGTPINASKLNDLEDRIDDAISAIETELGDLSDLIGGDDNSSSTGGDQ